MPQSRPFVAAANTTVGSEADRPRLQRTRRREESRGTTPDEDAAAHQHASCSWLEGERGETKPMLVSSSGSVVAFHRGLLS